MDQSINIKYKELIDEEKVKTFNESINSQLETLKDEMEGEFEIKSETTFKKSFKSRKVKPKIPSKKNK